MKKNGALYKIFNACSGGKLALRDILEPTYACAAQSPTAQAALAWLKTQDIDIVVDPAQLKRKVWGRYSNNNGKRRILLSPALLEQTPEVRLDTLVHEIRHAWQDAHGLMLPYSFMYNMQYGLKQAFLLLCIEEADAHVNGVTAFGEATGRHIEPLMQQALFIDWFNQHMPTYLETFVTEWVDLLDGVKTMVAGDSKRMQHYLNASTNVGAHRINAARLRILGNAFSGVNYMEDGDFHTFVIDRSLPLAATAYRVKQGDDIAKLTSTMDELTALAPPVLRTPKMGRAA